MPVMPSQDSLSPAASLIAFCRLPVPGQVKTRLAYSIGADAACEWYSACAQYTVALCSSLPHLASLVVYHSCKDESEDIQQWLGAVGLGSPRVAAQRKGGDLGDKMLAALQQEAQRHPKVIIVGSDVPGLSVAVLEAAVRALDEHEVVLGPAVDGGYYLLGLTRVVPQLFQDIAWSTDTVLDATVKTVHSVGLKLAPLHSLPVLRDIDHLADLRDWVAGLPPPIASPRRADIQNNLVDSKRRQLCCVSRTLLERST
ncbi:nucleotide-diphospho-sugar transferase [Haematococcus lacustris]